MESSPRKITQRAIASAIARHPDIIAREHAREIVRFEHECLRATLEDCARDNIIARWSDKRFLERYSANCGRIIAALELGEPAQNHLLRAIMSGLTDAEIATLARASAVDLAPEFNQKYTHEIATRDCRVEVKHSSLYKCFKCGFSKTTVQQIRTRAADEDSTTVITCINCRNCWRR